MSLVSDVTDEVKHPPTCRIHSPFTGVKTEVFFFYFYNVKSVWKRGHAMHIYVIQFGRQ